MSTLSVITGIASLLGGSGLLKGKKQEYTSGLSPQAEAINKQMGDYISQGLNRPTAYADVNPMSINAMDMISRMFMGKGYTQPNYGISAPGGGPSGMGMPQQTMPQYPPQYGGAYGGGGGGQPPMPQGYPMPQQQYMPQGMQGMPQQMGPMYPPRQFYGQYGNRGGPQQQ